MNNERETKSGTKPDLWASTAPLREKGGSGAAGTLWAPKSRESLAANATEFGGMNSSLGAINTCVETLSKSSHC